MANTKATTQTNRVRCGYAALGVVLGAMSCLSLFYTLTPTDDLNDRIDNEMVQVVAQPTDKRLVQFLSLRDQQEQALAWKPSEPYGWARLSYLRFATEGNKKHAFEALEMSDLVSPYEAPQLANRAYDWRTFRSVETKTQQDYQDRLWANAFIVRPEETWTFAQQHNLVAEVEEALGRVDHDLYAGWKGLEQDRKPLSPPPLVPASTVPAATAPSP